MLFPATVPAVSTKRRDCCYMLSVALQAVQTPAATNLWQVVLPIADAHLPCPPRSCRLHRRPRQAVARGGRWGSCCSL